PLSSVQRHKSPDSSLTSIPELSLGMIQWLLRLKRSLTFMRSKSVENFFQRSQSDAYLPKELLSGVLPSSPRLFTGPAPGNSSAVLPSPSISSRPAPFCVQPRPAQTHSFLEHVFRRPTSCSLCKLIIAESKAQLDPVYATLRFGTSLANTSRSSFGSFYESPSQSLVSDSPYTTCGKEGSSRPMRSKLGVTGGLEFKIPPTSISTVPKVHPIHTYVALYKFLPQEQNDLELHPGDRVMVIDDSNEEWWKGKCGDKVGLFPANFVQRVRPGERVWKVTQSVHGNKDLGHLAVKEAQICVGKNEETGGFLKLSSGKKRGLVPTDSLEEI
uniref:SH3 domain-containing protein n=1 Tax=Cyprinus carpio TaxID=7962 RepID=A0A8C2J6G0_CYPCA